MTATTANGVFFDGSDLNAGTTAIGALGIGASDIVITYEIGSKIGVIVARG